MTVKPPEGYVPWVPITSTENSKDAAVLKLGGTEHEVECLAFWDLIRAGSVRCRVDRDGQRDTYIGAVAISPSGRGLWIVAATRHCIPIFTTRGCWDAKGVALECSEGAPGYVTHLYHISPTGP